MTTHPDELLRDARAGDGAAVGRLLEQYRRYLALLARVQIGQRLQGKADASDLVQETFLEAHRNFPRFEGASEPQFVRWLRQILAAKLADLLRRYLGAQARDVRLEREIEDAFDRSSVLLDRGLVSPVSSPSQQAARREQAVLLADALAELPDAYREVLVLRHLEGHTFPEVARRMGRSLDSVEKLWLRALAKLRQQLGGTTP
jgi:RNA polymerase sigma-70 factor (ECF subfamily)